ncbi:hypothetical protein U9M48_030450 [Paspalum notatum var. saurae]|uniref:Uncharacterized protein n=1 Tax=Paspalum notatum var. saurae TaxID=547442 RepID=A0AAQ3U1G3_PASNO
MSCREVHEHLRSSRGGRHKVEVSTGGKHISVTEGEERHAIS